MAGIVGVVGNVETDSVISATSLLMHHPTFERRRLLADERLYLASVHRANAPSTDAWSPIRRTGVLVYGAPLLPSRTGVIHAREMLELFLERGIDALTELDGGFTLAILDANAARLVIMNDRMATHTVQYARTDDTFAFAPEGKAVLRSLNLQPHLDAQGSAEFLTRGFALADHTIFEGVHLLPPASILSIDLTTASHHIETYWQLRFVPDAQLRRVRDAVNVVHETLRVCVERAVNAVPDGYDLLLTGGLDSRTLLAMSCSLGKPPDRTMTWGMSDHIERSDPALARELATDHGVRNDYLHYDHEGFACHAERWAFISELGSDNMGNFAAGADFLLRHSPVSSAVFNGDQALGFGSFPVNIDDSIELGAGVPARGAAPGITAVLGSGADECAQMVQDTLLQLLADRIDGSPKDILDFLGWHTHGIRWLNAPLYHREPMVSPWRPMVHNPVLQLIQSLPPTFRVDKNLLPPLLARHYPKAARIPHMQSNSLVDWDRAFTAEEPTRSFFSAVLDAGRVLESPIGYLVDEKAYRTAVQQYLATEFAPVSRSPLREAGLRDMRRGLARSAAASVVLRAIQRNVNAARGRKVGASSRRVIQRFALIELLLSSVERGWFESSHPEYPQGSEAGGPAPWSLTHRGHA